jgi:RNAse (barnase) inhibitor barstar
MAWQVAVVLDKDTNLDSIQILLGQMPVWASATDERKEVLHQLNAASCGAPEPGFTVFTRLFPEDPLRDLHYMLSTIEEHHPSLSTVRLFGIISSAQLTEELQELGYHPLLETSLDGLGFAKSLNQLKNVPEIRLDAASWQTADDFYLAFFEAVGAPSWHGHNFDALNDSIGTGTINKVEVPYRIVVQNSAALKGSLLDFAEDFRDLIHRLQDKGCPVDLVIERP